VPSDTTNTLTQITSTRSKFGAFTDVCLNVGVRIAERHASDAIGLRKSTLQVHRALLEALIHITDYGATLAFVTSTMGCLFSCSGLLRESHCSMLHIFFIAF